MFLEVQHVSIYGYVLDTMLNIHVLTECTRCLWCLPQAQHKGGPRLTCSDVCQDCLKRLLQGLVNSEDLVGLREQLLSALDIDEDEQQMRMQTPSSRLISKTWMLGFRRRSSTSTGSKTTLEPPTAGTTRGSGVRVECKWRY
jgi:hypothetical protein